LETLLVTRLGRKCARTTAARWCAIEGSNL
jgi:hypothetical protein